MVNKKGWIKIMEAFVAILLLMGVLIIVLEKEEFRSEKNIMINQIQMDFFYSLQVNDNFRNEILDLDNLPINSNDSFFPASLKSYLSNELRNCFINICLPIDECNLEFIESDEIYSKNILINSNLTYYSPRKLKLFCY